MVSENVFHSQQWHTFKRLCERHPKGRKRLKTHKQKYGVEKKRNVKKMDGQKGGQKGGEKLKKITLTNVCF